MSAPQDRADDGAQARADPPLRVVLVDDHAMVRDGLRRTLAADGIEVVGEAGDGVRGVEVVADTEPDVVLMDVSLPGIDGLEATRRIRRRVPRSAVVVLTMHAEDRLVGEARSAGASGYLVKDATAEEVVAAVRAVAGGRHVLSLPGPDAAPVVDPTAGLDGPGRPPDARRSTWTPDAPAPLPELTERQRELLQLLADGHGTEDVAQRLGIAPKTVRNHLSRTYSALGVGSRSQAIVEAMRLGLVDPP